MFLFLKRIIEISCNDIVRSDDSAICRQVNMILKTNTIITFVIQVVFRNTIRWRHQQHLNQCSQLLTIYENKQLILEKCKYLAINYLIYTLLYKY